MLGTALGFATGGLMDFGMGALNASSARAEGSRNRRHQRTMAQNRYQWAVKDLKAAGLNPVLAATGGLPPGGGGGGGQNMTGVFKSNAAANASAGRAGALEKAHRQVAANQVKSSMYEIAKTRDAAAQHRGAAEREKTQAELNRQLQTNAVTVRNMNAAQGTQAFTQAELNRANAKERNLTSQLLDLQITGARQEEEMFRNHPELRKMKAVLGSAPSATGLLGTAGLLGLSKTKKPTRKKRGKKR